MPSGKKISLSNNMVIAIACAVTAIVVVVSFVAGRSLVKRLTFNAEVISKKTAAKNQLNENLANIPALKQNYQTVAARSQLVLSSLPTSPDFTGLAGSIELITNLSGISLKSVTLGAVTPSADIDSPAPFQFTVSTSGSYTGLLQFLQNIELSARPMRVDSVNITGSTEETTAIVIISSYYQLPADLNNKSETITK